MYVTDINSDLAGTVSALCSMLPSMEEEMRATGLYTEHRGSTAIDHINGDAEMLKNSVGRLAIRFNDPDQVNDVYQCIVIMHDRMNLEVAKLNNTNYSNDISTCRNILARLRKLRNSFAQEHKGVDIASKYADKNGELYTPNTLLLTEHQRVLERGRIRDID